MKRSHGSNWPRWASMTLGLLATSTSLYLWATEPFALILNPPRALGEFILGIIGGVLLMFSVAPNRVAGSTFASRVAAVHLSYGVVRYNSTGRFEYLSDAIAAADHAIRLVPRGDASAASNLSMLSKAYLVRYTHLGHTQDLEAASTLSAEAYALARQQPNDRVSVLTNRANVLATRFRLSGNKTELNDAIEIAGLAVSSAWTPAQRVAAYDALSGAHLQRFQSFGNDDDLTRARQFSDRKETRTRARYLALVSDRRAEFRALFDKALRTGDREDLDSLVTRAQSRVKSIWGRGSNRAPALTDLAMCLKARHDQLGNVDDLNAAEQALDEAVTASRPHTVSYALSALGAVNLDLYKEFDSIEFLQKAESSFRGALDAIPHGVGLKSSYLIDRGLCLLLLSGTRGHTSELTEAARCFKEAFDIADRGGAVYRIAAHNLGILNSLMFADSRNPTHLDEAITWEKLALDSLPTDHPQWGSYASALSFIQLRKYQLTGSMEDLDEAHALMTSATSTAICPEDHTERSGRYIRLGHILQEKSQHDHSCSAESIREAYLEAMRSEACSAEDRIGAACALADYSDAHGDLESALAGLQFAVRLFPRLAWKGLPRRVQQDRLRMVKGLTCDAASAAARMGKGEVAVEILENGRSILWSERIEINSPVDRVRTVNPALADEMESIRRALDLCLQADGSSINSLGGNLAKDSRDWFSRAARRRRLAGAWDCLVRKAREELEDDSFLNQVSFSDLRAACLDGPIVIVNTGRYGSHALVIDAGEASPRPLESDRVIPVLIIPLEELNMSDVEVNAAAFRALTDRFSFLAWNHSADSDLEQFLEMERGRHRFFDLLEWLWNTIAEPVTRNLEELGRIGPGLRPHVRWCLTGDLTIFPLHAAGRYPRADLTPIEENENLFDRVISSYMSSLKVSASRSRQAFHSSLSAANFLLVGAPDSPGQARLQFVDREIQIVAETLRMTGGPIQLQGDRATRRAFAETFSQSIWVHLACHGKQDLDAPDSSALHLADGPVTLSEIAKRTNSSAEFAYLSACSTASMDLSLADEAVTLAAAVNFIGFRHVIACLWAVADEVAVEMARDVYKELVWEGWPQAERAAVALSNAVQIQRAARPGSPMSWVPFVHICD